MKLKTLVLLCLLAYMGSVLTIITLGYVLPKNDTQGDRIGSELGASQPQAPSATTQNSGSSNQNKSSGSSATSTSTATAHSPSSSSAPTSSKPAASPTPSPAPAPSPSPSPAPAPAPASTPPPAASCGSPGGACSAAQVAAHNSSGNCWVIYSNKYYIVTSYVSKHNGGTSVFNSSTCGHDISAYLSGSASTGGKQHSHSGSAYTVLQSYYVGPVQ